MKPKDFYFVRAVYVAALSCACMVTFPAASFAAPPAPPRPVASERLVIEPGQSHTEKMRMERAHHNKTHMKKDKTKED